MIKINKLDTLEVSKLALNNDELKALENIDKSKIFNIEDVEIYKLDDIINEKNHNCNDLITTMQYCNLKLLSVKTI